MQKTTASSSAAALQTLILAGNAAAGLAPLRHLVEKGVPVRWEEKGGGILLQDCPLNDPGPEVVKQGNEAIQNYFREQDEQGTDTLYEAKLLIVGEPSAGKTSLCRRMLYYPGDPLPDEGESTRGIDIHRYDFPLENGRHFRVNVWDFGGGQEIYHATHQFFLTKRSLYILLDGIQADPHRVKALKEDIPGRGKKIFLSYSKKDRAHLEELKKHLSLLTRNGHIQSWDDHEIQPGQEWDAAVQEQLADADIILLLVSADFLATEYIRKVEIKEAMARHELGEAKVIPIVVRKCDWETAPFGKLNCLPPKGKTVTSYTDPDEAWTKVVEGIRRVIELE